MDFLLPSDEAMDKMAEEYSRALSRRTDAVDALSLVSANPALTGVLSPLPAVLLLYFAFALGYNCGYGNALADSDGNLGRFQSRQGRDGDFHYFFPRK